MGIICATLCYVLHEDKVLMIFKDKKLHSPHYGKYNGLGGKFEPGETPEDCVKREVLEESGLSIINMDFCGMIQFPSFYKGNDWMVFIYTAQDFQGKIQDSPEGSLVWVNKDRITDLPLWEGDSIFLPWIFEDRFFSAKFNYDNGHYLNHEVVFYGSRES